jgi:hypothetical protein
MEYNITGLNNYGFISTKLSDVELAPIKAEIDNIQKNFDSYENQIYNMNLAGNIKREYQLIESKKYMEQLLMPLVGAYDKNFNYIKKFRILTHNVPIVLDSCWVNYQKKYEFNPVHNHAGLLSFVIWTNISYDMKEELKLSPGAKSNLNSAGMFSFLYSDATGTIRTHDIPVDKSMENTIIVFPSSFLHMVYPFFSSDEYRISVSGNFLFKTG